MLRRDIDNLCFSVPSFPCDSAPWGKRGDGGNAVAPVPIIPFFLGPRSLSGPSSLEAWRAEAELSVLGDVSHRILVLVCNGPPCDHGLVPSALELLASVKRSPF